MSMINCEACGNTISKKAGVCPKCGHPNKESNHLSLGQVVFYLGIAIGFILWKANGGFETQVANDLSNIQNQVATDSVSQYNIVKNQGDLMSICVQAGMVAAAFLQAKDNANYTKWKQIEDVDCRAAGVPR